MKICVIFVVSNHKYGDRVPVQIGTQVIDQLVATMTEKGIAEGWGNLEIGTPWHHSLKKKYCKRP